MPVDHQHRYRFTAPLWEWDGGPASWFFITLPEEAADEIAVSLSLVPPQA